MPEKYEALDHPVLTFIAGHGTYDQTFRRPKNDGDAFVIFLPPVRM
jgi:hypothetical protein